MISSRNARMISREYVDHIAPASFGWGNFCKVVYYGYAGWPSYSYWIVPGTITDEERVSR